MTSTVTELNVGVQVSTEEKLKLSLGGQEKAMERKPYLSRDKECLSHHSIAVKKHHVQGNFQKEAFHWN